MMKKLFLKLSLLATIFIQTSEFQEKLAYVAQVGERPALNSQDLIDFIAALSELDEAIEMYSQEARAWFGENTGFILTLPTRAISHTENLRLMNKALTLRNKLRPLKGSHISSRNKSALMIIEDALAELRTYAHQNAHLWRMYALPQLQNELRLIRKRNAINAYALALMLAAKDVTNETAIKLAAIKAAEHMKISF